MKTKHKSAKRDEIVGWLNKELRIDAIEDVSCNGLQVQGVEDICRIGLVVDACLEAYQAAVGKKCQMVIAHHGMIWNGLKTVSGPVYRQIKCLFENGINLYAAHLPLDLHAAYGNNAELARQIGLRSLKLFGNYHGTEIGYVGVLNKPVSLSALSEKLKFILGGQTTILPFGKKQIKRVAIVSGSAGSLLQEGIDKNVDCYITGESKHEHHHLAKEGGLSVIYCGHYHSETLGVMALGRALEKKFGVECVFLDVETIV
jgi:dinuclear metal center YbgI/SA1388 family protein